MAIYHSLVCYSNLVPSGHRPHSPRRLFRKLRSCHASLRASFSQKRCQCVLVLIYHSHLDGTDKKLCINEFIASRLEHAKQLYFILRIEVGDSQHRGTTPLEEFDAHQEVSLFFCSFLVFHTWSETSHRCRHGESLPQCLLKKVYRDGAAQPPKDHRPHRQSSSASTLLDYFRGKFWFCEWQLLIYLLHWNELIDKIFH